MSLLGLGGLGDKQGGMVAWTQGSAELVDPDRWQLPLECRSQWEIQDSRCIAELDSSLPLHPGILRTPQSLEASPRKCGDQKVTERKLLLLSMLP